MVNRNAHPQSYSLRPRCRTADYAAHTTVSTRYRQPSDGMIAGLERLTSSALGHLGDVRDGGFDWVDAALIGSAEVVEGFLWSLFR